MPTKKHAYAELPLSKKHASQGKNVRTITRNSAFPRALLFIAIVSFGLTYQVRIMALASTVFKK